MINWVSFPVLLPLNVALPQAFNSAREKHKIQAKPNFFIIFPHSKCNHYSLIYHVHKIHHTLNQKTALWPAPPPLYSRWHTPPRAGPGSSSPDRVPGRCLRCSGFGTPRPGKRHQRDGAGLPPGSGSRSSPPSGRGNPPAGRTTPGFPPSPAS